MYWVFNAICWLFQLSTWLVQIGQATLRNRGDLGIDVYTAKDFVELHERLNKDLQVNAW